jgi:hypothetical protein
MVAHLWAAYIAISSANKNTAFPCKRADLPVFLSFAEEIRGLAMVKRAHGSSHPIVGPNVAISIAPEGLPRTKIQWDPGELYPSLFY